MSGAGLIDVHETRARASEVKFLIDADRGRQIREWARGALRPDPHGTGIHADEYSTTTLYFDTNALDVLCRRGSFGRAKYRVRRYDTSETVFLERKLRRPRMLVKRRTEIPLSSVARLAVPASSAAWEGAWFERRLRVRGLAPMCQIGYRRTARFTPTDSGAARLTLDTGMTAVAVSSARYVTEAGVPLLEGQEILEMKFRDALPPVFARLVHEFRLIPQFASKYRLGMAALGYTSASPEADVASIGPHV
jgi:VTC domain